MQYVLFHGTDSISAVNIVDNGIDLSYGEDFVDNGKGFYATPSYEFAKERAIHMAERKSLFENIDCSPAVVKITVNTDCFKSLKLKAFEGCSSEWQEFILLNRMGGEALNKLKVKSSNHNIDGKFDIVIDETADAKLSNIVSDALENCRSENELPSYYERISKSAKKVWGRQVSFHTEEALKSIIKMEIL